MIYMRSDFMHTFTPLKTTSLFQVRLSLVDSAGGNLGSGSTACASLDSLATVRRP